PGREAPAGRADGPRASRRRPRARARPAIPSPGGCCGPGACRRRTGGCGPGGWRRRQRDRRDAASGEG
ncbi:MAG: hypothetical protein F4057_06695, partial [Acidobacteria bacterium]|nr:hypothetical protein [Acidobacteriota bacterium]